MCVQLGPTTITSTSGFTKAFNSNSKVRFEDLFTTRVFNVSISHLIKKNPSVTRTDINEAGATPLSDT